MSAERKPEQLLDALWQVYVFLMSDDDLYSVRAECKGVINRAFEDWYTPEERKAAQSVRSQLVALAERKRL